MLIVQLSGGLGNQMFEYALYLRLKLEGRDVKIDDRTCYGQSDNRPIQLAVFGLDYERATREELVAMTDASMALSSRIRRKLTGRRSLAYREKDSNFDPEVLIREPALLEGCFQSEKYFSGCTAAVRDAFAFREVENGSFRLIPVYAALLEQIRNTEAVSVHIRRGDYLDPSHEGIYTGICDEAYYQKALERMERDRPGAQFYLFSNDPSWVKTHMAGENRTIVEGSTEDTGWMDLYLMSRCRAHIIANSSFSWWGAWLGGYPGKQVIAPARWLNGREVRDIYTEDMIRI